MKDVLGFIFAVILFLAVALFVSNFIGAGAKADTPAPDPTCSLDTPVPKDEIRLRWLDPDNSNTALYKIYYGTSPGYYTFSVEVEPNLVNGCYQAVLKDLPGNTIFGVPVRWHVGVSAITDTGDEGGRTDETNKEVVTRKKGRNCYKWCHQ